MPPDLPPVPQQALLRRQLFGDRFIPINAHPGLVFERYFRCWASLTQVSEGQRQEGRQDHKRQALQAFVEEYNQRQTQAVHQTRLAECHTRLDALVSSYQGIRRELATIVRLTIGLGTDHPLGNGFTFDYALGVPYFSGSTIKGLCRAWTKLVVEENSLGASDMDYLFGTGLDATDRSEMNGRQGALVFLPAYPKEWPQLEVDLMTPHHAEYYSANPRQRGLPKRVEPLDIESPKPIYFLTVPRTTVFVFRMLSRSSASSVQRGMALLEQALAILGIGAKTAVGYGLMQPVD